MAPPKPPDLAKAFREYVEAYCEERTTVTEWTERDGIKSNIKKRRVSTSDLDPVDTALHLAEHILSLSGTIDHQDRSAARVIEALRMLRQSPRGMRRPDPPDYQDRVMTTCATRMLNVAHEWWVYWGKTYGEPKSRILADDEIGPAAEALRDDVMGTLRFAAARLREMSEENLAGQLAFGIAARASMMGGVGGRILPDLRDRNLMDAMNALTESCFEVIGSRTQTETDEELAQRLVVACAKAAGHKRPSSLFDASAKKEKRRLRRRAR